MEGEMVFVAIMFGVIGFCCGGIFELRQCKRFVDDVQRLLALESSDLADNYWRQVEYSPPKYGDIVEVKHEQSGYVTRAKRFGDVWLDVSDQKYIVSPTHWRPLKEESKC